MRWKLSFAVGRTICWLVPSKRMNVAGADVRVSMLIPSQSAVPTGTIAIAVGIAPEVCITGKVAPRIVMTLFEPIAGAGAAGAIAGIEPVVVVVFFAKPVVADEAAFAPPFAACAISTTATSTTRIPAASSGAREDNRRDDAVGPVGPEPRGRFDISSSHLSLAFSQGRRASTHQPIRSPPRRATAATE